MSEFVLSADERDSVLHMLDRDDIDLASAVPVLTNADILRLPAVLAAAMCFGLDVDDMADVELGDDSTIHW